MKSIGVRALAFAVSVASAANPAESGGTSADSMSGMMGAHDGDDEHDGRRHDE